MERLKLQGRAAELRQKIREFETRADNHIITVRSLIDPFEDWMDLKVDQAEQAMISLRVLVKKANEYRELLKKIEKELGDE